MTTPLTRREVLVGTAATVAAAQFSAPLWGADAHDRPGVQLYMLGAEMRKDAAGTLAKLAAIGYGYVEAFSMNIGQNASLDVAGFKKSLADAGLGCPSGHFPFGFVATEKALDDASALGVKFAVSSVLPPEPPKGAEIMAVMQKMNHLTADDFKRMAALANTQFRVRLESGHEIGESAGRHGLEYAYHNHNIEFRKLDSGETGYDILLKETDPKLVKLEVDAGWMAAGGADTVGLIAANANRVRLLHFKDFSTITPPINELGGAASGHIVDLGTGVVPLKAAYRAARKAGVKYFIVDHDPPFQGKTALEAAKVDYDYVAGLMAS